MHDFSEEPYRFEFSELSAYAKTESLVRAHFRPGELVVDVGCGYAALAERCVAGGFGYLGLDIDPVAIKDVVGRGFEAYQCEITGTDGFEQRLREIIGSRPVAGFLLLDVLEHLVDSDRVLRAIRSVAVSSGIAPLIICLPNITHFDLGAKLLLGRWDETEVGICDRTHVGYYSASKLVDLTRATGWRQVGQADFQLDASDQHFPADDVALIAGTPLNSVLRHVRDDADEGSDVVQFVRAFIPGPSIEAAPPGDPIRKRETFLSVLTRTQGTRLDTLQETLLCLAAQECDDFEVLVLAHNVAPAKTEELQYLIDSLPVDAARRCRIVPVTGRGRCRPLNAGLKEALGTYVAVLDDDDLVLAHWVAAFKDLATHWPGRVLRARVAAQQVERGYWPDREGYVPTRTIDTRYPAEFDLFDHLVENHSPPCGLAFPTSCFRDLGLGFDETLPVLEDWDVFLQAALLCGVASTPEITAIYHLWEKGPSSSYLHTAAEWRGAHQAVIAKLDRRASIFPAGSITRVRDLQAELATVKRLDSELQSALAETEQIRQANLQLHHDFQAMKNDFERSMSWKLTRPIRKLSDRVRGR